MWKYIVFIGLLIAILYICTELFRTELPFLGIGMLILTIVGVVNLPYKKIFKNK